MSGLQPLDDASLLTGENLDRAIQWLRDSGIGLILGHELIKASAIVWDGERFLPTLPTAWDHIRRYFWPEPNAPPVDALTTIERAWQAGWRHLHTYLSQFEYERNYDDMSPLERVVFQNADWFRQFLLLHMVRLFQNGGDFKNAWADVDAWIHLKANAASMVLGGFAYTGVVTGLGHAAQHEPNRAKAAQLATLQSSLVAFGTFVNQIEELPVIGWIVPATRIAVEDGIVDFVMVHALGPLPGLVADIDLRSRNRTTPEGALLDLYTFASRLRKEARELEAVRSHLAPAFRDLAHQLEAVPRDQAVAMRREIVLRLVYERNVLAARAAAEHITGERTPVPLNAIATVTPVAEPSSSSSSSTSSAAAASAIAIPGYDVHITVRSVEEFLAAMNGRDDPSQYTLGPAYDFDSYQAKHWTTHFENFKRRAVRWLVRDTASTMFQVGHEFTKYTGLTTPGHGDLRAFAHRSAALMLPSGETISYICFAIVMWKATRWLKRKLHGTQSDTHSSVVQVEQVQQVHHQQQRPTEPRRRVTLPRETHQDQQNDDQNDTIDEQGEHRLIDAALAMQAGEINEDELVELIVESVDTPPERIPIYGPGYLRQRRPPREEAPLVAPLPPGALDSLLDTLHVAANSETMVQFKKIMSNVQ